VSLGKGKYVWFLSQDAIPVNRKILDFYLSDFRLNSRVVAVFGENIPYKEADWLSKLEAECYWERTNIISIKLRKPYVVFDPKNPVIPKNKKNLELWYRLTNPNCIYLKNFLIKNPFPKIDYGEDYYLGKIIFEKQLIKVYDRRCAVIHSHDYTLESYIKRQIFDFKTKYLSLKIPVKNGLTCKLTKVLESNFNVCKKTYYLFNLFFIYLLKTLIMIYLSTFSKIKKGEI
jgi:rhamnosyltransferase